jgi:hypothetical protein
MPKALFARVAPFDPKRGRTTVNVHCEGTLFRGGGRPIWYKVGKPLAAKLVAYEQPTGAPMFEIVDEDEKAARDKQEEARRLVAMGMISETVNDVAAPRKQEIDLTGANARTAAIPTADTERGGDLTTAELSTGPVIAPAPPPFLGE